MNELVINTHNFESAKNRLKEFSKIQSAALVLNTVEATDDTKIFNFVVFSKDHKVTGSEFNSRLSVIQKHFIDLNTNVNKTISEFGEIYKALEALDKDYIQAILTSIKATEETSKNIVENQDKIKRINDNQEKTLEKLWVLKQKLDNCVHLDKIDKIWNEFEKFENVKITLRTIERKINDLSKKLEQQLEEMLSILDFIDKLEKSLHLFDIDKMWDSLINVRKSLTNISDSLNNFRDTISKQNYDIKILLSFKDNLLSYKHLKDIDEIWNKSEKHQKYILKFDEIIENQKNDILLNTRNIYELNEYKTFLSQINHLADVDEIWEKSEEYQLNFLELNKNIENLRKDILSNIKDINELYNYKNYLEKIKHLNDVDTIWEETQIHIKIIEELEQENLAIQKILETSNIRIAHLNEYKERLDEIKHLKDIDDMWSLNELHSKQLIDIEKESIEIKKIVQTNKEDTDNTISNILEKNNTDIKTLTKKIKISSWIAITALGFAFVELVFILLKVK